MQRLPQNAGFFPSKASMLVEGCPFKQVKVYSNHFPINILNDNFAEYHVKIFANDHLEHFNPDDKHPEESVPADSRKLRDFLFSFYRKKILGQFGPNVLTGATMFIIQSEELKNRAVISGHENHFLFFELKNSNINNSILRANEKCRVPYLRMIHSFIKKILMKSDFHEWGKNKKYYNKSIKTFLAQHNITVYQGSTYSCDLYEGGLKLLISPTN